MKVTLKDGSVKEYAESKAVIDIAYDISEGLARAACAGEVDGEVVEAVKAAGLEVLEVNRQGEWVSVVARKNG